MQLATICRSLVALALIAGATDTHCAEKIVIAHRGASGFLPEHTLEAYAVAHALGADYIEPDLVMTKDKVLIALHDIHLESTTNAAEVFPSGKRPDGHWYAADFTLAEIKTLAVHERMDGRFPKGLAAFEVPSFEEVVELIQGLNKTTGRETGLYPELKQPSFHRKENLPMEARVLEILSAYGYEGPEARVFIQCFEAEPLQRIRVELGSELPLIQLISNAARQRTMRTREGLEAIAAYANGVGPAKDIIEGNPEFVVWAHALKLAVHPYTMRDDDIPKKYADAAAELNQFYLTYNVDGLFTDFPGTAVQFLKEAGLRK